jgi:hypothetical protein
MVVAFRQVRGPSLEPGSLWGPAASISDSAALLCIRDLGLTGALLQERIDRTGCNATHDKVSSVSRGIGLFMGAAEQSAEAAVATLFRLVIVLAVLTGIGFAAMYALATLVQPDIREIVVPIPADRLPRPTR